MKLLKYFLIYIPPVLVFLSVSVKGIYSYTALIVIFIVIPIIELAVKGSPKNMSDIEESFANESKLYDYILYSLIPIQFGLMMYSLYEISSKSHFLYEKIGMVLALGISCGLSINLAHELGHRVNKSEQGMSKFLLLLTQYMHFFIEHNKGHHKNVSTDEDAASSRYGENLYLFLIRTIYGSWVSTWNIEKLRLERLNLSRWSIQNEMIQFQLIQTCSLIIIYFTFGLGALIFYLIASLIGIVLLETVNYIQHYGLRRKKKSDNYYERTLPIHSWNSNQPLGRILLFELTRHSDHHAIATRKYQILRHIADSPELPTGYPGSMILATFPPLWFHIIHKKIHYYKSTEAGKWLD
mgnify:CR=1 FL=1